MFYMPITGSQTANCPIRSGSQGKPTGMGRGVARNYIRVTSIQAYIHRL